MAPASDDPVNARDQQCFLVDQVGLCRQLAAEARRLFPRETGAFTVRWGLELADIDFDARVAKLKPTGPAHAGLPAEEVEKVRVLPAMETGVSNWPVMKGVPLSLEKTMP
jgi:hypothetical protein